MSYDSSYRAFLNNVQSGTIVSVAVIGERDMTADTSWTSLLRSRLQSFNLVNIVTVYSTDAQTIDYHIANTVALISAQNPRPAVTFIELGSMASATGSPARATLSANITTLVQNLITAGTTPIVMDGGGVYNSFAHDVTYQDYESIGKTNGVYTLRSYYKFLAVRHYDLATYATLYSDSWRLTVTGHAIIAKEVIEWVSQPDIIKWKNANPIVGTSYNGSFVTNDNNLELFFDGSSQIYRSTLSGPNYDTRGAVVTVTGLNVNYSTVFKHPRRDEWYCLYTPQNYLFETVRSFYIKKSIDHGATWTNMNGGQPVFSETKVNGNPWAYVWNCDIYIDNNDVWHLFADSMDQPSSYGINFNQGLNYSYAPESNLGAFQTNKMSVALTHNGEVTPAVVYVPERNALIMLFSDFSPTYIQGGWSGVRAMTCDLSNPANINDGGKWVWSNAFNMSTPGIHITDPFMASLPSGKDSKIAIGWFHNQIELYYSFLDLDMPTLYDVLTTNWATASIQQYNLLKPISVSDMQSTSTISETSLIGVISIESLLSISQIETLELTDVEALVVEGLYSASYFNTTILTGSGSIRSPSGLEIKRFTTKGVQLTTKRYINTTWQ